LYHDIVCNSAMISRYRRWWSLVRLHCQLAYQWWYYSCWACDTVRAFTFIHL